jgi:hypothetical protein
MMSFITTEPVPTMSAKMMACTPFKLRRGFAIIIPFDVTRFLFE